MCPRSLAELRVRPWNYTKLHISLIEFFCLLWTFFPVFRSLGEKAKENKWVQLVFYSALLEIQRSFSSASCRQLWGALSPHSLVMQIQRPSFPREDTEACKLTFPAKISGKSSQPELSAVWITVWEETLGAGEEEGNGGCELINGVARQDFNVYFLLFVLWHKAFTLSTEGPGLLHPFLRKISRVRNIFWIVAKQIKQACLMPGFGSRRRLILDRGQFSLQLIMGVLHRWTLFSYIMSKWSLFHIAPFFSSSLLSEWNEDAWLEGALWNSVPCDRRATCAQLQHWFLL